MAGEEKGFRQINNALGKEAEGQVDVGMDGRRTGRDGVCQSQVICWGGRERGERTGDGVGLMGGTGDVAGGVGEEEVMLKQTHMLKNSKLSATSSPPTHPRLPPPPPPPPLPWPA